MRQGSRVQSEMTTFTTEWAYMGDGVVDMIGLRLRFDNTGAKKWVTFQSYSYRQDPTHGLKFEFEPKVTLKVGKIREYCCVRSNTIVAKLVPSTAGL